MKYILIFSLLLNFYIKPVLSEDSWQSDAENKEIVSKNSKLLEEEYKKNAELERQNSDIKEHKIFEETVGYSTISIPTAMFACVIFGGGIWLIFFKMII